MESSLSKKATIVQEALKLRGFDFQVLELAASTRTAKDAAQALSCEVAQIVKSLVFRRKTAQKPFLLLVSGTNRVNERVVAAVVGDDIEKPDAEYVSELTGFPIGGVPPLAHKQSLETFIDKDLLRYEILWAAAGTPHAVFQFRSYDLQAMTDGVIIQVT